MWTHFSPLSSELFVLMIPARFSPRTASFLCLLRRRQQTRKRMIMQMMATAPPAAAPAMALGKSSNDVEGEPVRRTASLEKGEKGTGEDKPDRNRSRVVRGDRGRDDCGDSLDLL